MREVIPEGYYFMVQGMTIRTQRKKVLVRVHHPPRNVVEMVNIKVRIVRHAGLEHYTRPHAIRPFGLVLVSSFVASRQYPRGSNIKISRRVFTVGWIGLLAIANYTMKYINLCYLQRTQYRFLFLISYHTIHTYKSPKSLL